MNVMFTRLQLGALALAATLFLCACGGGDASPPAESAPPTVNITSSVISGAAAGPVTFTFTFSEDVGSSFTADTVSVTNGTKGAFTKVSPTQYTLVVTPAANSAGSIGLSVAADAVADLVGNKMPLAVVQVQSFDTRPPTVAITNNASGGTAKGSVTFTFNFSKDVGSSFTTDDVVVVGAAKGAFARVSGTQFTLEVTPASNTTGTISVSIANGAFADTGGAANPAPSNVQLAFDTVPKTQMSLPVSFDLATVDYGFIGFAGAEDSSIVADPTNAANKVARVVRAAGAKLFAGTTVTGAGQLGFSVKVPFTANDTRMSVRVRSPDAGIPVRLKLEDHTDPTKSVEAQVNTTQANTWETLTFNFAAGSQVPGTAALNLAFNYTKATIFFDFGRDEAQAVQKTYYFDDIAFGAGSASGGSTGTCTAPPCIDFGGAGLAMAPFGGLAAEIAADPADAANKTVKLVKTPAAEVWAGATIDPSGTGANKVPAIGFATSKTVTLRLRAPAAGEVIMLKAESAADPGVFVEAQATTTKANEWETLTFNFAAPTNGSVDTAKTYDRVSIFPHFGTKVAADSTYYADELKYTAASSSPVVFSTGFGAGNRTVEGGAFGGYSGSSLDSFGCSGDPAWCGSGGSFTPAVAAAASSFFYYYQTPSPVTALYAGVFVQAPGLATGLSSTGDTGGVSISGKTTMKFTLGQNAEWFSSPTNNFGVILTLGKFYDVDAGPGVAPCNIKLLAVVTPSAAAASNYAVPLSSFGIIQSCNVAGLDVAAALALSPLSQVDFQAVGSSNPLPAIGGKLVGANMSVGVGTPAVYPSTIALGGGITFE